MEAYLTSAPALPVTFRATASIGQYAGMEFAMSRKNKGFTAPLVTADPDATLPGTTTDAPAAPAQSTEQAVKRSLQVAREANASNAPVDLSAPVRAALVRPAKGENPERRRVFGYDNGPGGKVPTSAKVVVVNAGSLQSAYPALAEALSTTPDASVADIKSAGVSSKSFRRAFRSGLIRFKVD